ncbi:MAG TPA: plastocyanin/azurin family copper-binding protein, partial [Polyangiaceae bacterium]
LINGCTSFADNTASGVSNLAWGFGIMSDPNHCAHIKAGQTVKWTGDFTSHPLAAHDDRADAGGGSPNPITSGATSGSSSVTITFPNPGVYGYWCTVHQTMMMGAIVVD